MYLSICRKNAFSSHDQNWGFWMPPPSHRCYYCWFCLSYEDLEGMPVTAVFSLLHWIPVYSVSENICSRIGLEWPKVWEMWHGGIAGNKTWCSYKAVRKITGVFLLSFSKYSTWEKHFQTKVVKTYPDLLIDLINKHFLTAFSSENFLPSSKPH